MRYKLVETIWDFFMDMMLEKQALKKTQLRNDVISRLFASEWAKQILIWNYPNDNYNLWNLKLLNLN